MHRRAMKIFILLAVLLNVFIVTAGAEGNDNVAGKKAATEIVTIEDKGAVNKGLPEKTAVDKDMADKAAAAEKALAEKMAAEKAAAEKAAALEKALAEKEAADKEAADKAAAAEKAAAEKAAAEKAAAEKAAAEKAAAEKAAAEKAAAEKAAVEKAAAEKAAAEKAAAEKAAAEKAAEKAAAEKVAAEKAAEKAAAEKTATDGSKIPVAVNSSRILQLNGVERIAVANPDIADVIVISGTEVMVVGKSPGTTTMHIWGWAGRQNYTVEVSANDVPVASEIKRILGLNDIKVTKAGKTIILEGSTSDSYQRQRAEKIASAYAEKVVNLLEITQPIQVKIEAKILELQKSKEDELGIKWGSDTSSPGLFSFGQSSTNSYWGDTLGKLGKVSDVNGVLSLLVKSGAAKVLSQPNLVTVSGESANILVGGQVPVPVSNSNGSMTVEWKDYGIKLEITPEVNSAGLISGKVKAEVTSLDSANKVAISTSLSIPAIKVRKAEAYIALQSGQTMAIAGLLSRDDEKTIYKLPILGDLPVLGSLFKSKAFTNSETELVILVTPTLVSTADYMQNQSVSPAMRKMIENK